MTNHIFKVVRRGSILVFKEGYRGTGKRLRFTCGFCHDEATALPTHAFLSQRERNRHTNQCTGTVDSSERKRGFLKEHGASHSQRKVQ